MGITLDPQAAQYLETFQSLTPNEQKIVTQALEQVTKVKAIDSAADALANAITGKSFSRQERIQVEMETLSKHFQHRRQLLESSLTVK
jgi:hypothetical protein